MKKEIIKDQELKSIAGGNVIELKSVRPFKDGFANSIDLFKDLLGIK